MYSKKCRIARIRYFYYSDYFKVNLHNTVTHLSFFLECILLRFIAAFEFNASSLTKNLRVTIVKQYTSRAVNTGYITIFIEVRGIQNLSFHAKLVIFPHNLCLWHHWFSNYATTYYTIVIRLHMCTSFLHLNYLNMILFFIWRFPVTQQTYTFPWFEKVCSHNFWYFHQIQWITNSSVKRNKYFFSSE